jgi:hypothetical protein
MGLACGDYRVPDAGHGRDPKKEEPSMPKKGKSIIDFNGQPVAPKDYHPVWLNSLADDVTLEGSAMNGFVQGPEAVRPFDCGLHPNALRAPGVQLRRPLRREQLSRGLHGLGPR